MQGSREIESLLVASILLVCVLTVVNTSGNLNTVDWIVFVVKIFLDPLIIKTHNSELRGQEEPATTE